MDARTDALVASYDRVAQAYAARYHRELDAKPADRALLDRLVAAVGNVGPICDLGCGPGQIARYLHQQGVDTCGIDLSPAMVRQARHLNPTITFCQGDMRALTEITDNRFGGIAAFYSIIHVPRDAVVEALRELRRLLKPRGILLVSFHIGRQVNHVDEWWGEPVSLDFVFFEPDEMARYLVVAGLEPIETIVRDPYPEVEVQTRRAYLFARKP